MTGKHFTVGSSEGADMTGNGPQDYLPNDICPVDLKEIKSIGKEKCYCSSPGLR